MNDLNALVTDLARLRQREAELDAAYRKVQAEFEEQYELLIARRKEVKALVLSADENLRHAALVGVMADITAQHPHPAVQVKFVRKSEFDGDEARDWAIRNMPALVNLTLNDEAYDKLLRGRADSTALARVFQMPGRVYNVPTVYIDRDLSDYLPAAEDESEAAS